MGKLIKFNIHEDIKKVNNKTIGIMNIKELEGNISGYSLWLKSNNKVDKLTNYVEYLQIK
ncbi:MULTISPECIES: hypothetical protein [unclassified Clostridium]|uniref:hypothetical protein n=1 Tax=unclassified Clostridium TaxID=2614128 RepID=UPI00029802A9|nr:MULTISPECIES: hypothetical protein [unclassified Clostridium]EKQ57989.1 MAG: hypothetical protein A370_00339 [Clostridium sp. Maddingley MBC34-26]